MKLNEIEFYVASCTVTLDLAEGLNKMWFCKHMLLQIKFIRQSKQEQRQISTSLGHLVSINDTSHKFTIL